MHFLKSSTLFYSCKHNAEKERGKKPITCTKITPLSIHYTLQQKTKCSVQKGKRKRTQVAVSGSSTNTTLTKTKNYTENNQEAGGRRESDVIG